MNLTFDTDEMRAAAGKLREIAENYESVYKRMMNSANTMGKAWDAPDNTAFVERINGFLQELMAMKSSIDLWAAALEADAKQYDGVRDNNINTINKLAN